MKKLLIVTAALLCLAQSSQAQFSASTLSGSAPNQYTSLDTVADAGTKNYYFKVTDKRESVTFQVNAKKITGTVGGTVKVYASIDGGLSWVEVNSQTITDGDKSYGYAFTGNPWTHYRVGIAGTGTQTSSYRTYILVR